MLPDKKLRVLIVDDHPAWRKALYFFLTSFSQVEVVGEVSNGYVALEVSKRLHPDLILLDINMPGMSGYETARSLLAYNPQLQILGVSANVPPDAQEKAKTSGFPLVVAKDRLIEYLTQTLLDNQ